MPDRFIINGGKKLEGEISVSRAKNSALPILAASLLTADPVQIKNLPRIEDVARMKELMADLGANIAINKNAATISADRLKKTNLNYSIADRFRASIVLSGPLLARFGSVSFPHPGGCTLGKRPINFFIDGFRALGAKVETRGKLFSVTVKKLKGTKFVFPKSSVTGAETLMMAATLAQGKTILRNAAQEPEVENLAGALNKMGAKIKGAGTSTIEINGVDSLAGTTWEPTPDRIEAGTFILLAAASKSCLKIKNCNPSHIEVLLEYLDRAGVNLEVGRDYVIVKPSKNLLAQDIVTREYPGFATDLQAPWTVFTTQTRGLSMVHETIYDGRLFYTDTLNQMGADIIMADPHRVIVKGPTPLFGKKIASPDIRAGMALLIAALVARGQTIMENIYQIDRGYERIDERLKAIGADMRRVEN
ncbi:UDP-N-acetylglucosamine 1-carboxyvinyltransferase [Candidatus Azambacteria bacterium RIFCSPLOWO2_02_FULL_44_14]|uniref:UDP-N-acetylglucosamine 1-carboxyvinyltransferase n=1 Tax=Candidatus Azambacteria bacterium RIFCSPLOWO2_02_FULL_44_14 TaxID=1797306 RepID=A0A1F5CBP5_9BACT|nr:MAG: UDP-N-acetylglucosamine 1-carboxyvinyltransferase [Candidatus Azambacteria bacterium RIFCSPLOWO2_02_FULL_44_14]